MGSGSEVVRSDTEEGSRRDGVPHWSETGGKRYDTTAWRACVTVVRWDGGGGHPWKVWGPRKCDAYRRGPGE